MRRVIVTAVSDNMFVDFMFLYESIRMIDTHIPIIVSDLELSDHNRHALSKLDVSVRKVSFQDIEYFKSYNNICWRQWFKPHFFQGIDADVALWIDADALVVRDLTPLLEKAEQKFFALRDYFDPKYCLNDPSIYRLMNVEVDKSNESLAVNSGVIGWSPHRDRYIIDKWYRCVQVIISKPEYTPLVRLFDQGALLIALHNLKLTDHVYDIKSWNSNPTKRQLFHFDHTPISRTEIINQIKETNFNAVIVHYAGLPKMSQLCETNSPVIHNIIKRRCLTSLKIIMLGINSDLARSTATQFMNHTIDDSPYQLLYDDISTVDAATTAINRIDSTLTILTGENIWDVYRHCHKIDGLIIPIKSPIDEIQSVMNLRHISVSQATTYAENLLRNAYDHCRISRTPFIILWADLMQEYGQIIRQACAGHNLNLINDDKSIRRLNKAKPVPCKSNLSTQERIYVLNWFTLLMRDLQMIIPSPIVGII